MISISDIQKNLRGTIAVDEPMAKYTWMKVGGPADFYIEPADKDDLLAIIRYFRQQHFPWMMIGRGSNVLVSDEGIRGAVLNVESALPALFQAGDSIVAESGVRLTKFVDFCIQHGFAGSEMLAGIPGTIGGAVVMNAGAHGGVISDHLLTIEVIRDGIVEVLKKEEAEFSYRGSALGGDIVLAATFEFPHGEKEELSKMRRELIIKRNDSQPLDLPNLGSMFKNPKNTHAAKLIEQAGLKGKRIGDAQVSEKHANFIVNLGTAKADDVIKLIELVKRTVYQHFGVMLELEVKLIGFPFERQVAA
ncbi:MAG: UDP-N-acetylmuramate dehydrogenase [Bacteroidota bacterium]